MDKIEISQDEDLILGPVEGSEIMINSAGLDTMISSASGTLDLSGLTFASNTLNGVNYGNVTINGSGNIGNYIYTTNNTGNGYYSSPTITTGSSNAGLHVSGDAEFDGDVKIKGRSIEKLLRTIEDRLAIIQEPDPKKLEKFAALKKAYDHYKTLERLIGED